MKAITIHQPWAWAIAAGHKRVENRTWATAYRGTIAIHAGSSRKSIDDATAFCRKQGIEPPAVDELTFGAVIAVAGLVAVMPADDTTKRFPQIEALRHSLDIPRDPWAFGPQVWYLENIRPLREPVPCSGQMGLFDLPADVVERIEQHLSAKSGAVLLQPPLADADGVGDVATGIRD